MALMYEFTEKYEKALEKWDLIRSKEACERTIQILKKASSKEWATKYSQWVFFCDPEMGLKLFCQNPKDDPNRNNNQESIS